MNRLSLLPNLCSLRLRALDHLNYDHVLNMIQSRWNPPRAGVARLNSVHLQYLSEFEGRDMLMLDEFKEDGMEVHVRLYSDDSGWSSCAETRTVRHSFLAVRKSQLIEEVTEYSDVD